MIIKSQLCLSLVPSMTMDCNTATPDTNSFKHIANV